MRWMLMFVSVVACDRERPAGTASQVQAHIDKLHGAALRTCISDHRDQLTAGSGTVEVTVHVLASGTIDQASSSYDGTPLGDCIAAELKKVSVTGYEGGDAKAKVPLNWKIAR